MIINLVIKLICCCRWRSLKSGCFIWYQNPTCRSWRVISLVQPTLGGMLLYFTSLFLSGAFWEQNWCSLRLRKTEDFGSCRGTSQHFFIWGNSKSSKDLLLFGSCNLFLSCWEKWWNWGCYLKSLLHRVQLCSQSTTVSCPLQMLMHGWNYPHWRVPQCGISVCSHIHAFWSCICK